ncbi:hypothetical protein A4R44_05895 [Amycolatopsis sp. M39]|nr:hypothetical protein A4R44_05895 [Amycolatopsis sp. M39]
MPPRAHPRRSGGERCRSGRRRAEKSTPARRLPRFAESRGVVRGMFSPSMFIAGASSSRDWLSGEYDVILSPDQVRRAHERPDSVRGRRKAVLGLA